MLAVSMPVKWHLLKQWKKPPLGFQIFHWRSKDGEEIDFLIQKNPTDLKSIAVIEQIYHSWAGYDARVTADSDGSNSQIDVFVME